MGLSEREYLRETDAFLSKPMTESMEEIVIECRGGRKIYRYDYSTNEYGVINEHDNAGTYYNPEKGAEEWESIIKAEGKKK